METSWAVRLQTITFSTVGDLGRQASTFSLERDDLATPPAAVGRDDRLGASVVVAVGDGFAAETAENDAVRSTDAGTGEHRNRQFGIIGM